MLHIAVDIGSQKSHLCVREGDGTISWEGSAPTMLLDGAFRQFGPSRVILEACTESEAVSRMAEAAGHEVRVVPSMLSRQLGVGHRGVKTDRRDARALSEASCRLDLPGIHRRSREAQDRLRRLGSREALVTSRTKLINTVRGYLRSILVGIKASSARFPAAVRLRLKEIPSDIECLLQAVERVTEQIEILTKEIETAAANDPVCKLLMTAPGVGPITALAFSSAVESPSRFPNAARVASYLGLAPGESSSSTRVQRTGITKAGCTLARKYLTQASLSLRRVRSAGPVLGWAREVKHRRGAQVATVAVARKLSGILFAMMRDRRPYDPTLSAAA